ALQPRQQLVVPAREQQQQAVHVAAVLRRVDVGARVAGARAAADVVVEAGPVLAPVVLEVAAGADGEDAPQVTQRPAQRLDVGERTQVARAVVGHTAGHRQARPLLLNAQLHEREALVVLQEHVVVRPVLADERGLQQHRLDLGAGEDGVQVGRPLAHLVQVGALRVVAEVAPDAGGEARSLAHVEHLPEGVLEQVHPRKGGQIGDLLAQCAHGALRTYPRVYPREADYSAGALGTTGESPTSLDASKGGNVCSSALFAPVHEHVLRRISMPHHKSAEKRVGTNELRRQRNVAATTRMRSAIKSVRVATTRTAGEAALKQTGAILDRTAAKGVIKRETANRHKSRLAKFVQKLPA